MGFGAQMLAWHEDFCRALADRGRHVIRYDNRDCGLSTTFDDFPVDMGEFIAAVSAGDIPTALAMVPYRLLDMAGDGLGLLTALGIERAHVVGASMGGMIAQTMAISSPERVRTLTSMMSSTGESQYGRPSPEAQAVLFTPKPAAATDMSRRRRRSWCGPHGDTVTPRCCESWPPPAMTAPTTPPGPDGTWVR